MRPLRLRAEHLGAAEQVRAPNPPEALVEFVRVERVNPFPVAVKALGPCVERQRVVAAQVLDVENLEPGILHQRDGVGEAWNPAAGKHVVTDEEFGFAPADVTDEMQHAEAAGLQESRVRTNDIFQLIASRMLEYADRHDFVERSERVAEIGLDDVDALLEPARADLALDFLDLLGRRVDAGDRYTVAMRRVKHEAAEAAADVDDGFAGLQEEL